MRKFLLYLYIVLAGVSITGFSTQNTFAEQRRTITFSSGYLEKYYTNRRIANFGVELFENIDFVSNKISIKCRKEIKNGYTKNLIMYFPIFSLIYFTDFYFIIPAFNVVYHEFGHAMRFKAFGYDYLFIKSSEDNYDEIDDIKANNRNFFKYFLDKIYYIKLSGGVTRQLYDYKKNDDILKVKERSEEDIIISAAGFNNEAYFQEKITEITYLTNEITISNYLFKLYSVDSIIFYFKDDDKLGDPNLVELDYRILGINANKKDMERAF